MAGIGVAILLILNPEVGIGDVAIKDILTVLGVGLEVGGLYLLAEKLDVLRCQVLFDEGEVAVLSLLRELVLFDLLLEHIEQVHRVGRHFRWVKVEHLGENLEGKTGGQAVHALVDPGHVLVLLQRLGVWIGILQVLTVVHLHLGVD